jgi:hypothetical protein
MKRLVRPKSFLKSEFYYNSSIYKEIYAIDENDMLRYKRQFVINEFIKTEFNYTYILENRNFISKQFEIKNNIICY